MRVLVATVAQAGSLLYRRLQICALDTFTLRRLAVGDTADWQSALRRIVV